MFVTQAEIMFKNMYVCGIVCVEYALVHGASNARLCFNSNVSEVICKNRSLRNDGLDGIIQLLYEMI